MDFVELLGSLFFFEDKVTEIPFIDFKREGNDIIGQSRDPINTQKISVDIS